MIWLEQVLCFCLSHVETYSQTKNSKQLSYQNTFYIKVYFYYYQFLYFKFRCNMFSFQLRSEKFFPAPSRLTRHVVNTSEMSSICPFGLAAQ